MLITGALFTWGFNVKPAARDWNALTTSNLLIDATAAQALMGNSPNLYSWRSTSLTKHMAKTSLGDFIAKRTGFRRTPGLKAVTEQGSKTEEASGGDKSEVKVPAEKVAVGTKEAAAVSPALPPALDAEVVKEKILG